MNTATLPGLMPLASTGADMRPGLRRLVAAELRKMVDTRAGFWLLVATIAITLVAVVVRSIVGDAADHTFAALLNVGVRPAAVILPIIGILLVTSEWSQRTGAITFALVPVRSRVFRAKLLASIVLSVAMLLAAVTIVAGGVLLTSPAVDGTWSDLVPLIAQSAVYLVSGMVVGVAFGAVLLASTPAIVALSTLPVAWAAIASLSFFAEVAPWTDTSRALDPLSQELLSATQWARAATALTVWMLVPLLVGTWRITRRDIAA